MLMLNTPAAVATRNSDILVDQVSLRYGQGEGSVLALSNLSLEVRKQEFCVIVGPSGCGKSSLLYLIAGLEDRTGGTIKVGGRPVNDPGADRGMVFQAYTLFPWLTVGQNVEYGPRRKGMPAAERTRIVDYYLSEIGLSAFRDHYPSQLSGGMKQRVAIARAMANVRPARAYPQGNNRAVRSSAAHGSGYGAGFHRHETRNPVAPEAGRGCSLIRI